MLIRLVFITTILAALSPGARGSVIAALESSSQTGNPGDTLTFTVTLTNSSATDQIWLNGVGATSSSPTLSIDTSLFNVNAPFFLDPLAVSALFDVFQVTIDPSTAPGPYIGSFVSIEGGADAGAGTAFDDLVDIPFDVIVNSGTTSVPEPANFGLLAVALGALAGAKARPHWTRR
jgi:hypothetical protein